MHIFLTGEKQVGKSTLVKKILSSTNRNICGIKSVSIFLDSNRNVYLFPICETNPDKEKGLLAGICSNKHIVEKHPEAFDNYGTMLLSEAKSNSLLVIDEIGNMESDAQVYSKTILALLERDDITILGVLQNMAKTELAEKIRNHKNIRFFKVTQENRDELYDIIMGEIK